MKKGFLYYYLTASSLGPLVLYASCTPLVKKDHFLSSPEVKHPDASLPSNIDLYSSFVMLLDHKTVIQNLKSLLVNHGIHEKVLGRLSKVFLI